MARKRGSCENFYPSIVLGQRLGTPGISGECMLSGTEGVTLRFSLSVSALLLMLPVYLPVSGSFIKPLFPCGSCGLTALLHGSHSC